MEVDDPSQASEERYNQNSDLEVVACYREIQPFEPQAVARRFMTTEIPGSLADLSIPEALYGPLTSEKKFPPSELKDLVLGQSPLLESLVPLCQQPIVNNHLSYLPGVLPL